MRKLLLLILLLIPCLLAGCSQPAPPAEAVLADNSSYYQAQRLALPGQGLGVQPFCYDQGSQCLYYTAFVEGSGTQLFCAVGDAARQLAAYTPPADSGADAETQRDHIRFLATDSGGTLWLGINRRQQSQSGEQYLLLQQVDAEGRELACIDTRPALADIEGGFDPASLAIDAEGNFYLADSARSLCVLNSQGDLLFKLYAEGRIASLAELNGQIAALVSGLDGYGVYYVDSKAKQWGQQIKLPVSASAIYSGAGCDFLFTSSDDLYAYTAADNTATKLLNWLKSDVLTGQLAAVSALEDGTILATRQGGDDYALERLLLTQSDSPPERTVITIGLVDISNALSRMALEFNLQDTLYQVELVDYAKKDGATERTPESLNAATLKLSTDIITGHSPDLLLINGSFSNLPLRQYAAAGALENLYPYLDSDSALSRESFVPEVMQAWDMDGQLLAVSPNFSITTAISRSDIFPNTANWTREQFLTQWAEHPEITQPLANATRGDILRAICQAELPHYVDWDSYSCNFTQDDFIGLLEMVGAMADTANPWEPTPPQMIADGAALAHIPLSFDNVTGFHSPQYYSVVYGGPITFSGLPTIDGNGHFFENGLALAMSSQSQHKEGCWRFLRFILSAQAQMSEANSNLPTNQAAFDQVLNRWLNPYQGDTVFGGASITNVYGQTVHVYEITQAEIDQLMALIAATSSFSYDDTFIMDIVLEEAAVYFAGQISAAEAAKRIQSRVDIYINEQK